MAIDEELDVPQDEHPNQPDCTDQSERSDQQPSHDPGTLELAHPATPADLAERVDVLTPAAPDDDPETAEALRKLEERRAKRKRARVVKVAVVGVLAIIGIGFAVRGLVPQAGPDDDVTFEPELAYAYTTDFETTVSATGTLKPISSVSVTPEVEGIIETLNVAQDQVVSEGDLLFTLKNDALDRAVEEANQNVRAAQNGVSDANAAVSQAQQAYNSAYAAWQASYAAWQAAAREAEAAEGPEAAVVPERPEPFDEAGYAGAISSARSGVESANLALENARTALADAQAQANKRQVKAPASGAVVTLNAEPGAAAGASGAGAVLQIADLSQMRVTVQVNEIDISTIEVGQTATVTFSALPDVELDARVERIASVATGMEDIEAYGGGGVVNFAVDLVIPEPDERLKPGMTASVTIYTQHEPDALVVPSTSVYEGEEGAWYVDLVTDEETYETERREVTVGARGASEVVIEDGLEEGDCVLYEALGGFGFGEFGDEFADDGASGSMASAVAVG